MLQIMPALKGIEPSDLPLNYSQVREMRNCLFVCLFFCYVKEKQDEHIRTIEYKTFFDLTVL